MFILEHSVVALNGPHRDSTRPSHPFVASLVISSRSSEGGTVVQRQIKATRVAIGNAARPTLATSNSHLEHHSRLPLQRARHDFGVQQKRGQPARLTACFPVGIPADIKPATPDSLTALVAPRTSAVLPAHREARPARLRADADDRMLAIPLLRSARHASRPHACRFRPRPSIRGRCPPKNEPETRGSRVAACAVESELWNPARSSSSPFDISYTSIMRTARWSERGAASSEI